MLLFGLWHRLERGVLRGLRCSGILRGVRVVVPCGRFGTTFGPIFKGQKVQEE